MTAGVTMNLKADEDGNGGHILMGILCIVNSCFASIIVHILQFDMSCCYSF